MRVFIIALCLLALPVTSASAQYIKPKSPKSAARGQVEDYVLQHAQNVAKNCGPGAWENKPCIKALSESNLVLAANYASTLKQRGKIQAADKIVEDCAASTAGREIEVPTYAIVSAFTTCANSIYDVSESTKIKPDQSHYQLLVYPTLCLSGDNRCSAFEGQLGQYR